MKDILFFFIQNDHHQLNNFTIVINLKMIMKNICEEECA